MWGTLKVFYFYYTNTFKLKHFINSLDKNSEIRLQFEILLPIYKNIYNEVKVDPFSAACITFISV